VRIASALCICVMFSLVGCATKQTMPVENYKYFGAVDALLYKCREQGMLSVYDQTRIAEVMRSSIQLWDFDPVMLNEYAKQSYVSTPAPSLTVCQDGLKTEALKQQASVNNYNALASEQQKENQALADDMAQAAKEGTNTTTFCNSVGTFSYCY